MKIKKISLDFDSVLWNLEIMARRKIEKHYGKIFLPHQISHFDFYKDYPEAEKAFSSFEDYQTAEPIQGSVEFLKELITIYGENNIQIVTSSPVNIIKEKEKLIKEIYNFENIIHSHKKSKHTKNTILIDDAIHNIKDHVVTNEQPALLFDLNGTYGWNKEKVEKLYKNVHRVHNYEEVKEKLKKYIN